MGRYRTKEMKELMEADKNYIPPNDKTPSLMKQKMYDCSYCLHWGRIGKDEYGHNKYGCKRTAECEAEEENYNALRLYGSKSAVTMRASRMIDNNFYFYIHNLLNLHIRTR